jgi:hypothetical protein
MAHPDENVDKLERALSDSYRARTDLRFNTVDVTQRVMRDIRRAGSEPGWRTPSVVFDQLVWRTATITAAVVLTVTVLTIGWFRPQIGENFLLAEEFESVPLFGE